MDKEGEQEPELKRVRVGPSSIQEYVARVCVAATVGNEISRLRFALAQERHRSEKCYNCNNTPLEFLGECSVCLVYLHCDKCVCNRTCNICKSLVCEDCYFPSKESCLRCLCERQLYCVYCMCSDDVSTRDAIKCDGTKHPGVEITQEMRDEAKEVIGFCVFYD